MEPALALTGYIDIRRPNRKLKVLIRSSTAAIALKAVTAFVCFSDNKKSNLLAKYSFVPQLSFEPCETPDRMCCIWSQL